MTDTYVLQEIRRGIEDAPMSPAQWAVVAVGFGLAMMDGFDLLCVTSIAPALREAWHLDMRGLGMILSSGLVGMAIGSLLLAPVADIVGRRPLLLAAIALVSLAMLASSQGSSFHRLFTFRVVAGVGVGAVVAVMTSIAAESTNDRWRSLSFAMIAAGFPAGGILAGLAGAAFLDSVGWRGIFLVGSVLSFLLIPIVAIVVPEPLAYLLTRSGADRVDRVNGLLRRFGRPEVADVPIIPRGRRSYVGIFTARQVPETVRISAFQLLMVLSYQYVVSWTPQLLANAGMTNSMASFGGALTSASGIVGALLFGLIAEAPVVRRLTAIVVCCLGVCCAALGFVGTSLAALVVVSMVSGAFAYAAQTGFYTVLPTFFASETRATGIGFALGVSRIGAALSPLLAGYLFSSGFDRFGVSLSFAVIAVAASAVLIVRPIRSAMQS